MKLLSVIIPCYNSQEYMRHCIDTLLPGGEYVEIIIVNDGSHDDTAMIAEEYAVAYPDVVRAIHQQNGGHGEAINTGLRYAKGLYLKIVDSDDWVDNYAYKKVIATLKKLTASASSIDMMISNFVYEKEGAHRLKVMHYENAIPKNRIITWDDIGHFRKGQYILMHSVIYRTKLLRDCGLVLPKHTFYVDNLYVYLPLVAVKSMYYLDVNFYRYYIGREDQSVNEKVMISRIDQQIKVNKLMIEQVDLNQITSNTKKNYMLNYLEIITTVSSVLLIRSGTKESLEKKRELWNYLKTENKEMYYRLRNGFMGFSINVPGKTARRFVITAYKITQKVVGFN